MLMKGNGTPLQYSCLEYPMDAGAWWATVHGVTKSQTQLSDFPFTFPFHALEKEMATHSSVLAWRIPGTREPSGLPSMGLHRVGHDLSWKRLSSSSSSRFVIAFLPCSKCLLISWLHLPPQWFWSPKNLVLYILWNIFIFWSIQYFLSYSFVIILIFFWV